MREKVGKSRFTVFFQRFVAPEGRKVGSLKRRVRSHLARGEMKNCTPLWREAHFEVKMHKTHQNTPLSDHFWKLRCWKSARRCGTKHISKSKCTKHTTFGPLLEVEMLKKCTPLWRKAHFQVKMLKALGVRTTFGTWDVEKVHAVVAQSTFPSQNAQAHHVRTTFGSWDVEKVHAVVARSTFRSQNVQKHHMFAPLLEVQMSFHVAGARDCAPCQKWPKTWGFCSISKNDGRHGTFEEDLQRCIFVAGAVLKTCSWEMLGGQGAHFLRGVAFWSIRCAGLLRWFCVTGAALRMTWHQFSVAGAVL